MFLVQFIVKKFQKIFAISLFVHNFAPLREILNGNI